MHQTFNLLWNRRFSSLFLLFLTSSLSAQLAPNILLIIADDLEVDSFELNNLLLGTLDQLQMTAKVALEVEGAAIRNGWSCQDQIQNGGEAGVDCGGNSCNSCLTTSTQDLELASGLQIFPNPLQNILQIQSEKVPITGLSIYNASGQLIWRQRQLKTYQLNTSLGHLEPQLLFVEIEVADQKIQQIPLSMKLFTSG